MAEVHHIHHDDSAAAASMTMMVAVVLILAVAAVIAVLAYNDNFFRTTVPADQDGINVEGDITIPPSDQGGTNY